MRVMGKVTNSTICHVNPMTFPVSLYMKLKISPDPKFYLVDEVSLIYLSKTMALRTFEHLNPAFILLKKLCS